MIPYPELSGEALTVWLKYLPMRREIEISTHGSIGRLIPCRVITEIERAKKATTFV